MGFSFVVLVMLGQYASNVRTPPEGALLVMHRTACFGRCPDYTLTIFEDHRVLFSPGNRFVHEKGEQTCSISATDLEALRGGFDAVRFDAIPEKYEGWATDLPWTHLCRGGSHPRCTQYEAGDSKVPQALFDLTARIDALTKSHLWVEGPGASPVPPDHAWRSECTGETCQPKAQPTEVQIAVEEIRGGNLDRARARLAPLAKDDALAGLALTCLELSAGNNRAAESAFQSFQAKAEDWPETPTLEALVAAREAGASWLTAGSRALSASSGSVGAHIWNLEAPREAPREAMPIDSPEGFLAQAASPSSFASTRVLKDVARAVLSKSGDWSARPVRLVALSLLLPAFDEADRAPAAALLDALVGNDPSDLGLSILRATFAQPMLALGDGDLWALERAVATGQLRSCAPEIYSAMREALRAEKHPSASALAYVASEMTALKLSAAMSLTGRAGTTLRDGPPETKQRLARILNAVATHAAASPRLWDQRSGYAMNRISQRLAGLDAGVSPIGSLGRDPSFMLKARAMGLARWPIPPLTDALFDGLAMDEAQTLEQLKPAY